MDTYSKKVVLITGSSRGLGAELAKAFSKLEANLVVTGRNADDLTKVANECKSLGAAGVLVIVSDLTIKENMEMLMKKTIDKFGRLDVLINNAAMPSIGAIRNISLEEYDYVMSLNARTPMYLTQLAIPHLEKTKGNIINMSSVYSSVCSLPDSLSYCISKAALDRLTKMAALDLAKSGIRVNAVNPAHIDTEMLRTAVKDRNMTWDEAVETFGQLQPLNKRFLEAEEVVDACLFLASDKAQMITGVTLPVDGGRLLTGQ